MGQRTERLDGQGLSASAATAAELTVANSYFSNNYPDNIFGPYTDGGGNIFN